MHNTDREAGITLVEIMVSLLVLGFVLTAFFSVMTNGLRSLSDSRAKQTSSQVATDLIEELRALSVSQIAMYNDPLVSDSAEFDASSVSCGGNAEEFDPDGAGPLGCEEILTNDQGAITAEAPWQDNVEILSVTTIATAADDPSVPDGTVRVTVVLDYELTNGVRTVRRSALFSEVSHG